MTPYQRVFAEVLDRAEVSRHAARRPTRSFTAMLLAMERHDAEHTTALGDRIGIGQGNASLLLRRMHDYGLVSRTIGPPTHPGARAPHYWSLTADGRELAKFARDDEGR